jgi:hypothetical protein
MADAAGTNAVEFAIPILQHLFDEILYSKELPMETGESDAPHGREGMRER